MVSAFFIWLCSVWYTFPYRAAEVSEQGNPLFLPPGNIVYCIVSCRSNLLLEDVQREHEDVARSIWLLTGECDAASLCPGSVT